MSEGVNNDHEGTKPSGEELNELNFPASLAIKDAIGKALDDHLGPPAIVTIKSIQPDGMPSKYTISYGDSSGAEPNLNNPDRRVVFEGNQRHTIKSVTLETNMRLVAPESEEHPAGEVGEKNVYKVKYVYDGRNPEDPSLTKTDWPGKSEDDEPIEVSHGEAKRLLDQLAELGLRRYESEDDLYKKARENNERRGRSV